MATVSENRLPYTRDVEFLFRTLRRFGGSLSKTPCVAYFVNTVTPALRKTLCNLDVELRITEPVNIGFPWANKIRMLENDKDFDYLVALDNDIVVCRDFSTYVTGHTFAAKPVDRDRFGVENWKRLFDYFGLTLPSVRFRTTFDGIETIPYFNSGVLIIPRIHLSLLRDSWLSYLSLFVKNLHRFPQFLQASCFADQIALSLALAGTGIPYTPLSLEMNFPIHKQIHAIHNPTGTSPTLLHHHHMRTLTGELASSAYPNVNRSICEINECLFPMLHQGRYARIQRTRAMAAGILNYASQRTRGAARRIFAQPSNARKP